MYGCRRASWYEVFSSTITKTCLGIGVGVGVGDGEGDTRVEPVGLDPGADWLTGAQAVASKSATTGAARTRAIRILGMSEIIAEEGERSLNRPLETVKRTAG